MIEVFELTVEGLVLMTTSKTPDGLVSDVTLIKSCVSFLAKLNDDEARSIESLIFDDTLSDEEKKDSISILLDEQSNCQYHDFMAKRADTIYQTDLLLKLVGPYRKDHVEKLTALGNWKIVRSYLKPVWTPWIEFVLLNLESMKTKKTHCLRNDILKESEKESEASSNEDNQDIARLAAGVEKLKLDGNDEVPKKTVLASNGSNGWSKSNEAIKGPSIKHSVESPQSSVLQSDKSPDLQKNSSAEPPRDVKSYATNFNTVIGNSSKLDMEQPNSQNNGCSENGNDASKTAIIEQRTDQDTPAIDFSFNNTHSDAPIPAPRNKSARVEVPIFGEHQSDDTTTNILLLGESGVGKTTFINALANYAARDSLISAARNGPLVLVKTRFNQTDLEYKNHEVVFEPNYGKLPNDASMDENEHLVRGESATQKPVSYLFRSATSNKIRIIDTPGIADTRGSDVDERNLQNILQFLRGVPKLHAICILLSPNKSRMTPMFRHCLSELLSQLHVSAANNILFCFTHSSQTQFEYGESLPTVRALLEEFNGETKNAKLYLNEKNTFMFDSESYRFLCAEKIGLELPEDARSQCIDSWHKSTVEAGRLFKESQQLAPHQTELTHKMHSAKAVLSALIQPLLSLLFDFANNIILCNSEKNKIVQCQQGKDALSKLLKEKLKKVRTVVRPCKPMTVCTASKCCKNVVIDGITVRKSLKVCHEDCKWRPEIGKIGAKGLEKCAVMNEGACQNCGCHWSSHRQDSSIVEYFVDEVENPALRFQFDQMCSAEQQVQKVVESLEKQIQELGAQGNAILSACAKFTVFLEKSSINQFSDDFLTCLKDSVNETGAATEAATDENRQNMTKIMNSALTKYQNSYKIFKTLDIGLEQVEQEIQSLYRLPCSDMLKPLIEHSMTLDQPSPLQDIIVDVEDHLFR